jgi:hypothetical protein
MIVVFLTATAEVRRAFPGSDSTFLTLVTSTLTAGEDVFTLADDTGVLTSPNLYNVDNPITPTATVLKNIIRLTPSATPINLSDRPQITIQLYQSDDTTPLAQAGVVVTLTAAPGLLSASSVTTDAGGTGLVTLKPTKGFGIIGLAGASGGYRSGTTSVVVLAPTTMAEQNWLEGDDVKDDAVAVTKLDQGGAAKDLVVSPWWFLNDAFLRTTFTGGLTDSINSVVSDGADHIYINGFDTGVATIKKINRHTGAVDGTLTYSPDDLASGYDRMVYDGENLWVPAGNTILKVNPVAMTLTTTYTPGAAPRLMHSLMWDGEFVWFFQSHSATANQNILKKINKSGTITTVFTFTAVTTYAEVVMNRNFVGFLTSGGEMDLSDRVSISFFAVASDVAFQFTSVLDLRSAWIGGSDGLRRLILDTSTGLVNADVPATTSGQVYNLYFDGSPDSVWAITSFDETGGAGRYLRKFKQSGTSLVIDQEFDLTAAFDPLAMGSDGQNLYIGSFAAVAADIVKLFAGR